MLQIYDLTSSHKSFNNKLKHSTNSNIKSKAFKAVPRKLLSFLLHAKQNHWVLFSLWIQNYSTVGSFSIFEKYFWHNFTMTIWGITSQQKIESKNCLCTRHVRNIHIIDIYWRLKEPFSTIFDVKYLPWNSFDRLNSSTWLFIKSSISECNVTPFGNDLHLML